MNRILKMISPYFLTRVMKSKSPETEAKALAKVLDNFMDSEWGNKKSQQIQNNVVPWLTRFFATILKELNKKGG